MPPIKINTVLTHFFGCCAFLLLPILLSPDFDLTFNFIHIKGFQSSFVSTVFLLLFFYLNYYLLIPRLYFNSKKIIYFISLAAFFIFLCLLAQGFEPKGPPRMHAFDRPPKPNHFVPIQIIFISLQFFIVFALSFLLRVTQLLQKTRNEKKNAELSYLKAQINPHFLFNSLNSIYALTLQKNDKAPDAILKLSGMMRYVLTESSSNEVSLLKELDYVKNYIELQTFRLATNVKLLFEVKGEPKNLCIAPLLLIPFIENVFKHGVNSTEDLELKIDIIIGEKDLQLITRNKIVKHDNGMEERSGLGIENTKLRLNLHYPNKHLLQINETEGYFSINLFINLND